MNSVTYILYKDGARECVLVDCGEYETLQPVLEELQLEPKAVLLTHGHSDHIYGLVKLLEVYPDVTVYSNEHGLAMIGNSRRNLSFYHGNPFEVQARCSGVVGSGVMGSVEIVVGSEIEVIPTPGHNPSCVSYRIGDYLFTGDSYVPGIKVFTGFPKANKEAAIESENKLKQLEMQGCKIMPGHHSYV